MISDTTNPFSDDSLYNIAGFLKAVAAPFLCDLGLVWLLHRRALVARGLGWPHSKRSGSKRG
jgi:hypothetical protein